MSIDGATISRHSLPDVDGFNLAYVVMPETYRDIIDLLIPELQCRGAYKKEYRPGTLREKLFRQGPYLPETHPGNSGALMSLCT